MTLQRYKLNVRKSLLLEIIFMRQFECIKVIDILKKDRINLSPFLCLDESHLPPILLRPYREMHPIRALLRTLNQQFIKLLIRIIRIIQQNHRIPQCLLDPKHPDIRRTPRQMI